MNKIIKKNLETQNIRHHQKTSSPLNQYASLKLNLLNISGYFESIKTIEVK